MIVVLMGVSGVGKSTIGNQLAHELGWQFADADSFHPAKNVEKMRRGIPLDDSDRLPWLNELRCAITDWLKQGSNVVLACSALKSSYRDFLSDDGNTVRFVYLRASFAVVEARMNKRRNHFMSNELLASQFEALEEPQDALQVNAEMSPQAIVEEIMRQLEQLSS